MYCSKCGEALTAGDNYCTRCRKKQKKSRLIPVLSVLSILSIIALAVSIWYYLEETANRETVSVKQVSDKNQVVKEKTAETKNAIKTDNAAAPDAKPAGNVKKSATQLIEESLEKVVTVYNDARQGSGFLVNEKGDILTNAHVVEGYVEEVIKDKDGHSYEGTVIGYSKDTDVAIIRVPDLAGQKPIDMDKIGTEKIGKEVIALGSPLGYENTATRGYITGVNRSFYIGERKYDHIYQMSAHIAPGSSGGPLISMESGKAFAINSAKLIADETVGFSIPINEILLLIEGWIANPLSEEKLNELFYNEYGNYYYEDEWDGDWYFEGGEYQEDEGEQEEEVPEEDLPSEEWEDDENSYYEYDEDEDYEEGENDSEEYTEDYDEDIEEDSSNYDEDFESEDEEEWEEEVEEEDTETDNDETTEQDGEEEPE